MNLRAEARAFAASTVKEWAVIRRYPVVFVSLGAWALILPLAYVAQASGYAGGDPRATAAFAERAGTGQVVGYLYLGWAIHLWISVVLWGPGMLLREERQRGTLEAIFLTPTSRFTVLFGPAPAHLLPALVVFGTVFAALRFAFGVPIGPGELARGLLVLAAATPALLAMGALFATAALRFQDAGGVVQVVRGLLTLLCGVTYPLAVLPAWAQRIGELLAPTHVIAELRGAVLEGGRWQPDRLGVIVLAVSPVVLAVAAMVVFAVSIRHARRTGRLGYL
ncbi:ABC transporter permease [Nonomuraea sp. NPDC048916]|uniref:ABC transporter permease n=1 Tax=Nonomuraea sp. NPDC048916 TaxID=3154232 RepID=UPI0033DF4CB3